jgi:hypothetical protein
LQWYFVDIEGEQHGPVTSKAIVEKLKEGDIDGLSLVFSGEGNTGTNGKWCKVSEVAMLSAELNKIATEEENARLAIINSTSENDMQNQVFIGDSIEELFGRTREEEAAVSAAIGMLRKGKSTTDAPSEGDAVRSYVADDGQQYVWDEQENEWIEADEEDAATEEKGGSSAVDGSSNPRKRQLQAACSDNENNEDDDDEEEPAANQGTSSTAATGTNGAADKKKKKRKSKKKKVPSHWVYVTGLPADVTPEELKSHFSKVRTYLLHAHCSVYFVLLSLRF